jgi:hypothetical protein
VILKKEGWNTHAQPSDIFGFSTLRPKPAGERRILFFAVEQLVEYIIFAGIPQIFLHPRAGQRHLKNISTCL